jgi:hypothetical protein
MPLGSCTLSLFLTPRSLVTLAVGFVDFSFYKTPTFPIFNFLYFNIVQDIATFYGTHPWHWYISQGLVVVALTHLPLGVYGWYNGAPFLVKSKDNVRTARLVDSSLAYLSIWFALI